MGKDALKPTSKRKVLIVKEHFYHNLYDVLEYTAQTFGKVVARKFKNKVEKAIKTLPDQYDAYPQNRFLLNTDKKVYRNMLMNSYYIIFSVTEDTLTVLDIIYQGRDPNVIVKEVRSAELT